MIDRTKLPVFFRDFPEERLKELMEDENQRKDKEYMAILDHPIEELKKPIGQPVDFNKVMSDIIRYNPKKKRVKQL